jgi:hypothetical protein
MTAYWRNYEAFSDIEGALVSLERPVLSAIAPAMSVSIVEGADVIVPLSRPVLALTSPALVYAGPEGDQVVALERPVLTLTAGTIDPLGGTDVVFVMPVLSLIAPPMSVLGTQEDEETLVYDSGMVPSTDTFFDVGPGILADDTDYRYVIDAEDAEGLVGSL